jgi:hypothetical protein
MRRPVSSITVALGLLAVSFPSGATAYAAVPDPVSGAGTRLAAAGQKVCTVSDPRLRELSGLVATKSGYVVVNDGTDLPERKRIFFLDPKCKVNKAVEYSGNGPLDTEDLALSADGKTLWVADIGDNVTSAERRSRVALWSMPVDGSRKPELHRISYPNRTPHDAEALLMADDGTPVIVTKTTGKAQVFVPAAALKTDNADPVPLKQVGEVTLPKSTTDNPLAVAGRVAVTGAARSPDGSKVVLRTYADAFEYDVSGGDIVKAITTGTPRMTPLADPFGEAISYTADGASFVTVSDAGTLGDDAEVALLRYTPSKTTAPANASPAPGAGSGSDRSWLDSLTLDDITYLIAAVGLIGVVLVGAGVFGILRSRRRGPGGDDQSTGRQPVPPAPVSPGIGPDAPGRATPPPPSPAARSAPVDPVGNRRPAAGAVYGAKPAGGGVYGSAGAARPSAGGVYGAGPAQPAPGGGNVYGGRQAGKPAPAPRGGVYGAAGPDRGGPLPPPTPEGHYGNGHPPGYHDDQGAGPRR